MNLFKNETISGYSYTPTTGYTGLYFDETGIAMRIDASGNTFIVGDGSGSTTDLSYYWTSAQTQEAINLTTGSTGAQNLYELTDVAIPHDGFNSPTNGYVLTYVKNFTQYTIDSIVGTEVKLNASYGNIKDLFNIGDIINLQGDRGNPTHNFILSDASYGFGYKTILNLTTSPTGVGYLTAEDKTYAWKDRAVSTPDLTPYSLTSHTHSQYLTGYTTDLSNYYNKQEVYNTGETYTKAEVLDANHLMFFIQTAITTVNIIGYGTDVIGNYFIIDMANSSYTGEFSTIAFLNGSGIDFTISGSVNNDGNYTFLQYDIVTYSNPAIYITTSFPNTGDTNGVATGSDIEKTTTITHNFNTIYPKLQIWDNRIVGVERLQKWLSLTEWEYYYNFFLEISTVYSANSITLYRWFGQEANLRIETPYMVSKF